MPDEAKGLPSPDGDEPDHRDDHGGADDAFASVVLDEAFVRAAAVHEPSAAERTRAATQARAEAEAAATREDAYNRPGGEGFDDGFEDEPAPYGGRPGEYGPFPGAYDRYDPYGAPGAPGGYEGYGGYDSYHGDDGLDAEEAHHGRAAYAEWARSRPARHRAPVRWQRPVAWVLAIVMGIGVIAMAFAAVYRGVSGQREAPRQPPATTEPADTLGGPPPELPAALPHPLSAVP
ncbi:hypothetical protein JJV70_02915 [Streptomyces sp. JJ66]|uniref:SCO2584 family spore wall biosynthesis protein n=1 Tax=Streptomyces sp. JJ66 TaxID=2803843 RepID=UPI001C5945A8|nr:hypothetical protein [Streptomyces sp. JJ66]MBW1601069.1 hypothetical protein [Streptomyces sp. JJ66]